jgi:hypothetical protein
MTPWKSHQPAYFGSEDRMKRKPKSSAVEKGAARHTRAPQDTLENPHAFHIRIRDQEAMKRAMMAWLEVQEVYHCFPNDELLVGRAHMAILRKEGIPFEALS